MADALFTNRAHGVGIALAISRFTIESQGGGPPDHTNDGWARTFISPAAKPAGDRPH